MSKCLPCVMGVRWGMAVRTDPDLPKAPCTGPLVRAPVEGPPYQVVRTGSVGPGPPNADAYGLTLCAGTENIRKTYENVRTA